MLDEVDGAMPDPLDHNGGREFRQPVAKQRRIRSNDRFVLVELGLLDEEMDPIDDLREWQLSVRGTMEEAVE